ncbi:MAG TPA: DUF1028 domain-containing protein [Bacillota bacterium]
MQRLEQPRQARTTLATPPRLATFSICGRCSRTGQLGVAIATRFLAVGALAPKARAGIGAVSTQAYVNPYHGYWMMEGMAGGLSAEAAVAASLARDPRPDLRQLLAVDASGRSAAHTGENCDTWRGHRLGPNFGAGGNMLSGPAVVDALVETFTATEGEGLPLAERLLRCIEAGEAAGGDKRGKQSAALLVVEREDYPLIDLRVDDHGEPVAELRRIYGIYLRDYADILRALPTRANPAGSRGPAARPAGTDGPASG